MSKVKLVVIKPWISKRIVELLGSEDEVLIGYCISMLEQEVCVSSWLTKYSHYLL